MFVAMHFCGSLWRPVENKYIHASHSKFTIESVLSIMEASISFAVALIVVAAAFWYFSRGASMPSSSVAVQTPITDGKHSVSSPYSLPRSLNQDKGIEFSYTCWIKIDDFAYRYGQKKVIFSKGPEDLSSECPALLVDSLTNSLLVELDTFGAREVIPISNIPAKKWIHVGIVVGQDAVDVYINGELKTHHSLSQMPKQNNGTVHMGVGGGFEGKMAGLQYYTYLLTPDTIRSVMGSPPKSDPTDANAPTPPYFAPS